MLVYQRVNIRSDMSDYLCDSLPWPARPFEHTESNASKHISNYCNHIFKSTNWYFIVPPGPHHLAPPPHIWIDLNVEICRYHSHPTIINHTSWDTETRSAPQRSHPQTSSIKIGGLVDGLRHGRYLHLAPNPWIWKRAGDRHELRVNTIICLFPSTHWPMFFQHYRSTMIYWSQLNRLVQPWNSIISIRLLYFQDRVNRVTWFPW